MFSLRLWHPTSLNVLLAINKSSCIIEVATGNLITCLTTRRLEDFSSLLVTYQGFVNKYIKNQEVNYSIDLLPL